MNLSLGNFGSPTAARPTLGRQSTSLSFRGWTVGIGPIRKSLAGATGPSWLAVTASRRVGGKPQHPRHPASCRLEAVERSPRSRQHLGCRLILLRYLCLSRFCVSRKNRQKKGSRNGRGTGMASEWLELGALGHCECYP